VRSRLVVPGAARQPFSATAEGCHFLCSCTALQEQRGTAQPARRVAHMDVRHQESNQRNTPPSASRRAAHAGALRSSVNRGTARNSLRSDTRASSPPVPLRCSARFKADPGQSQRQALRLSSLRCRHSRLWHLIFPPCSEPSTGGPARAKRRGCLSAASSAPSLDGPRSAGYRRAAPARGWRSVSLVTFLMAHIHVRHPAGRLRRSALLLQRGARAKKVTPLRGRGKRLPGSARHYPA